MPTQRQLLYIVYIVLALGAVMYLIGIV